MHRLVLWILLLVSIKKSFQLCSSTVAITTCSSDVLKPNKPLRIDKYKSYLSFTRGHLETIPSGSFKLLPELRILQLKMNDIKNLEDDSFTGLDNLRDLNLYDNQLTNIGKQVFPQCKQLEKLDLGMNKISSIHNEAFKELTALKFLNLAFNALKAVPVALNALKGLDTLQLYNNAIEKLSSNGLNNLHKLENLYVSDNKIAKIENHSFKGLSNLKKLDVSSNYLSSLDTEDILKDLSTPLIIKLSINSFSCQTLKDILVKLEKNRVEVIPGLSHNKDSINGISCKVQ